LDGNTIGTQLIMVLAEIQADIQAIEQDEAIYQEINFNSRANAIDFIDFHIIDRIEGLLQNSEHQEELNILQQRAEKIKYELEAIDSNLFKQLREKIRTGAYTGTSFRKAIDQYLEYDASKSDQIGYDNLDDFINGLLSDQTIPEASMEREPEMVFYQKTPARIIFELVKLANLGPDDVFFDLGSGLGQVAILVNLISGAPTKGVEFEPAYCNYATTCAQQLNLSNVEFINTDARLADYSHGTVFFLYTPFEGEILQTVLEILQKKSLKRTIRIFTYGPCSKTVALQHWLDHINGQVNDPYQLCEFKSLS
jgi:precorrin-6B methylase 2